MTQLLVSVKNVDEALIALGAGANIIDIKDPSIGALGALDLSETKQIVRAINSRVLVSATVGEQHRLVQVLISDIQARIELGVDIIKIEVSELFYTVNFWDEIAKLTNVGVKVIAVFFAKVHLDFSLLETLEKAGFYGAMLDTQTKQQNLLQVQTKHTLQMFTQNCRQYHLKSGLAGSLQPQHIASLTEFKPTYIGFRSGVCENLMRNSALCEAKVMEVKSMLRQHNKLSGKAH